MSFTPEAGNALVGTLGADRPGKPILFSGHMDTALASELYAEQPFRIEAGKAYGPGVVDMKGGLIIALYVAKVLNAVGYDERPLKILFVPDEEGSHQFTNVADYLTEEAAGCFFAFNMETGLMDNSLTVGRKGGIGIDVEVTGKAAHAGQAFFEGVNAIEEMAHKIVAFQALTDAEKGTTVNTGVIKGGTVPTPYLVSAHVNSTSALRRWMNWNAYVRLLKSFAPQVTSQAPRARIENNTCSRPL